MIDGRRPSDPTRCDIAQSEGREPEKVWERAWRGCNHVAYVYAGWHYTLSISGFHLLGSRGGSYSHGETDWYMFHGHWGGNGERARYRCWGFLSCYAGPFDRLVYTAAGKVNLFGRRMNPYIFAFWQRPVRQR